MTNLSDYTSFSLTELIEKISSSRYWNLPKMVAEAFRKQNTLILDSRPYKVYIGHISQAETDNPIIVTQENTLGITPVWTRTGVGQYETQDLGLFIDANYTAPNVYCPQIGYSNEYFAGSEGDFNTISTELYLETGKIKILTKSSENGVGLPTVIDNVLYIQIEIRVYN